MIIFCLLALITLAVSLAQIVSFRRLYKYVEAELAAPPGRYMPPLSVILPCKGLDPGFRENILKLLNQDYRKDVRPHFQVIFTVASEEDPSYPLLKEIIAERTDVDARLVVAGSSSTRAQKINNQLAALRQVADDSEVLVFVDSDVIARDDFLRHLVARLDDPQIGATTGYRFYVPFRGDSPSLIRSIWNRMTAWELANPNYAFAWGGAMAIRKSTFVEAGVAQSWDRAADDDLSLTTAVKKLGLRVHFVPQCLVASHGDASLPEVFEWTNRQLILTKVYYPQLWMRAIGRATIMAAWLVAVAVAAGGWAATGKPEWMAATAAGLAILPVELWFLLKAQRLWLKVLSDRSRELEQSLWRFCLAIPLAHLALPWMTLYSLVTNRIQWRGVTYELRSPTETVVVEAPSANFC